LQFNPSSLYNFISSLSDIKDLFLIVFEQFCQLAPGGEGDKQNRLDGFALFLLVGVVVVDLLLIGILVILSPYVGLA